MTSKFFFSLSLLVVSASVLATVEAEKATAAKVSETTATAAEATAKTATATEAASAATAAETTGVESASKFASYANKAKTLATSAMNVKTAGAVALGTAAVGSYAAYGKYNATEPVVQPEVKELTLVQKAQAFVKNHQYYVGGAAAATAVLAYAVYAFCSNDEQAAN